MKSLLLSCFTCLILSSCGGGGSGSGGNGSASTSTLPETINGVVVPPNPINPTLLVTGIDANANGIRDDVERILATRFSSTPSSYAVAISSAAKLQTSLATAPSAATQATFEYSKTLSCASEANQAALQAVEEEMLDTRERQKAALDAYVALIEVKLAVDDTASLSPSTCP